MFLHLILLAALLLPQLSWACAVCYGSPQDPVVQSLNVSVLFLLAVIGSVLVLFAAFFIRLWRLEKLHSKDVRKGNDI